MRRRAFLAVAAAALAVSGRGEALSNEQVVIERSNPQQPHRGKVLALITPHLHVSEKYYFARGPQLANRVVDIGPWVPQKIAAIESCETMVTHMVKDLNDSLAERGLRVPNLSGTKETAAQEFIQAAFVRRDRATGESTG